VLTTLAHHIDVAWLWEAFRRTRKDGAAGVDGQTAAAYEVNLRANLEQLLNQAKSGLYRAPPVRRVHIPKDGKGELRPLGIPTFEDKVLQRAVVMVLEQVYEQDFLGFSYGFRPGRSQHQALEAVRNQIMDLGCTTVLELDIRKFFDSVERKHMRETLRKRVGDGVLLRLIGKWLRAGVQHEGHLSYPEAGTPQGGVISPILANIFLHEVLDTWFVQMVQPVLEGRSFLVRFADDAVLGFTSERDARRVLNTLPKRLAKYGLTLHSDKTRLIEFRTPNRRGGPGRKSADKPGSFDFLGFTHYWGKSRRGRWVVKQKTAKQRLERALQRMSAWCRHARHWKVREQHRALQRKLAGHYAYYGITGNTRALSRYREAVKRIWRKWLARRSQKRRGGWDWFDRLQARYPLPRPRIVHSYVT
jgi:group II intron reverse transcriptase/maturase